MKKTIKNTTGKITAIYVRRSVSDKDKGNNSLSIDAQKEECIKYVGKGANYRIYCDDGKSGKDIAHRPAFQQMMSDAKEGLIDKIIVKKYDRFSRNMREYLNVTDQLDKYGVGVISLSEPFNTETKEGRMMRNNLLNFAEFERETIAARVADAYNTKARETGFYQGGKMYFGFKSERRNVGGKIGSVLVPSENAEAVRIAYELYQDPKTSLADIIKCFVNNNVNSAVPSRKSATGLSNMDRSHLSRILESALYVRADKEVYRYFSAKGYEMLDDVADYDGVHGLFVHAGAEDTHFVKLGFHEGLVPAETWLAVQDKKSRNSKFPNNGKVMNSWLVGMVKCPHCGYAVHFNNSSSPTRKKVYSRLIDYGNYTVNGCKKSTLQTRPETVENAVFEAMRERIESLVIAKKTADKPDIETENIKAEIQRTEDEIHKLMDKLANADTVLFDYIQQRVKQFHERKSELEKELRTKARKHKEIDAEPLTEPMSRWEELTVQEKHEIAVTMIDTVLVSDETGIEIKFSI